MKRRLKHHKDGVILHYGDNGPLLIDKLMLSMLRNWTTAEPGVYATMGCNEVSEDYIEFPTIYLKSMEELFADFELFVQEAADQLGVKARAKVVEGGSWAVGMWSEEDPDDIVSSTGFSPAHSDHNLQILVELKSALLHKDDTMFRRRQELWR